MVGPSYLGVVVVPCFLVLEVLLEVHSSFLEVEVLSFLGVVVFHQGKVVVSFLVVEVARSILEEVSSLGVVEEEVHLVQGMEVFDCIQVGEDLDISFLLVKEGVGPVMMMVLLILALMKGEVVLAWEEVDKAFVQGMVASP